MAIDYYQSEPPAATSAEPSDKTNTGNSALLPKSIVGEAKPGDTITLKVLHVYEDEVEVGKYESESNNGQEEMSPEAQLDELAQED